MAGLGGRPWLFSLGLHGVAGALVLGLLVVQTPPVLPPVRMHLVSAGVGTPSPKPTASQAGWGAPAQSSPSAAPEPSIPPWRGGSPAAPAEALAVPAPVSLDELLGAPPPAEEAPKARSNSGGWSSAGGEGYVPPPLPPPNLAPPQGARWSLVLSIPGGGGFATHFEGLEAGHPDLDRFLEAYLRTVSFPSSLDGLDYQLKWVLRLDTGRPQ